MAEETYKDILGQLTGDENRELLHRKIDCVMQGVEYLWNKLLPLLEKENFKVGDPKLQIPDYPQPNVIIYKTPNASGHPPFYADSDYIAENWPWPDVPPTPAAGAQPGAPMAQVSLPGVDPDADTAAEAADTTKLPGDKGVG